MQNDTSNNPLRIYKNKTSHAMLMTSVATAVLGSAILIESLSHRSAVYAAEPKLGIEEITVTARRREESLQQTPIAITALSGVDIEMRNAADLTNVSRFTPNLTFERGAGNTGGASNAQVFIRGVGQQDWLFTTEAGVGIYVDGVYFSRQMGNVLDLIDLERVEVLRGPQGTLFGKNSVGGAIQLISKQPTGEFGGFAEVTVGRFNRLDAKGSVDFAIAPTLAAKLSFASLNRDGYVKRLIDGIKLGDINADSVKLQLAWQAAENVEVLLAADYGRRREESIPDVAIGFNNAASFAALWNAYAGLGTYSSIYATNNPFTTNATAKSQSDVDSWGVSSTINWTLDTIALKSITAYRATDAAFAADPDNSPLPFIETSNETDTSQFSQEFQLSGQHFNDRLNWLLGAFYIKEKGSDHFISRLGQGLFAGLESLPGPIDGSPLNAPTAAGGPGNPLNLGLDIDSIRNSHISVESLSFFSHVSYKLLDRLSISGGIRYTHDKKDFTISYFKTGAQLLVVPPTLTSKSWSAWSPKLGLEYQITDDAMTYASVSKGFKSGGFNGRPTSLGVATSTFDPETVMSYEVGMKTAWFDRRLILNASAFLSKYDDIQLTAIITSPQGGIVAAVDNAGKAEIKGVEVELSARPIDGLDINASLGYTDAKYTRLNPGTQTTTLNSKFVKTPEWTYNIGAQYTAPLDSDSGTIILRADWSYRSSVFHTPNNIPILRQPGYGLLSARLVYRAPSENWELALFGDNLTNKKYITNGLEALAAFGTADATFGRPREWGLSAKFNF